MLTEKQKRHLRSLAHKKKPVAMLGAAGLHDNLVDEIDRSLEHHELIKVRVSAPDRKARDALIAEICRRTGAELVQRVGHVATIYRPNPENPRITLP